MYYIILLLLLIILFILSLYFSILEKKKSCKKFYQSINVTNTGLSKKKIVLLITGQHQRLELSSKIKFIIKPLSKMYDVHIVLSLSDTLNYTNPYKVKENLKLRKSLNIEQNLKKMSYFLNKITYEEFKINKFLVNMYDKKNLGQEFIFNRAINHIRQYYTFYKSWPIIRKLNPDILIRVRDDAMVMKALNLSNIINITWFSTKYISTPKENSWGGINDKFAIVSKSAIQDYLEKPFLTYNNFDIEYNKRIMNPEQFYKVVYTHNDIILQKNSIKLKINNSIL